MGPASSGLSPKGPADSERAPASACAALATVLEPRSSQARAVPAAE